MNRDKKLTASLEDYLEAIHEIIEEQEAVRPKNIADRLKVSQPSVTGALRSLAEKKLINYEPYGIVTLTHEGREIAQKVARRHTALSDFFTNILFVDKDEADQVACKIEHVISERVMERLTDFATYITTHKQTCSSWKFTKNYPPAKRRK